jgi:hypothetical protein
MSGAVRPELLRRVVYGVAALSLFGWGCDLHGCSCAKLPRGLLVREAPTERTFTDVEMLGDGSEPRVTLRVARWAGLRYRFIVEASGSLGLVGQPPVFGPTVVMTLDHEVLRGSADPNNEHRDAAVERLIEERAVLESARVHHDLTPKATIDAWNQSLLSLKGTSYRQRVSESAGIVWLKSELVGGARPAEEVRKAIDATLDVQRHFPFRLPPVPVGVGGRWRFRENIEVNGAHAVQVADMQLKAIDANFAVIGLTLRQEAPRQEVPHPLVPGAKAMLEQFRGDGEGELTVDRLTAIVVRGRLVGTAQITLSGEVGGQHGTATLVGASVTQARSAILPESDAGDDTVSELPGPPAPAAPRGPAPAQPIVE